MWHILLKCGEEEIKSMVRGDKEAEVRQLLSSFFSGRLCSAGSNEMAQ